MPIFPIKIIRKPIIRIVGRMIFFKKPDIIPLLKKWKKFIDLSDIEIIDAMEV